MHVNADNPPMSKNRYTADDVEIIDTVRAHDGYFKIDTHRLRHKLFDGGWGPVIQREIFERGHAVAVLPYDPVLDRVVLIEQYRTGAYCAIANGVFSVDASPWLIEAVAGIVDPGETPEEVARREMIEETGTEITDLMPVTHYLATPGGSSESVYLFVGRIDSSKVTGVHGLDHEGEDIRPFTVALDDAYAAITEGVMPNAMTLIAVQWLLLHKEKVLSAWS